MAKETKAKMAMLIAAAEASVNTLSAPSLILFVKGIAEEAADINKYATVCKDRVIKAIHDKHSNIDGIL